MTRLNELKRDSELKEQLAFLKSTLGALIGKVTALEEARKKQIELNKQLHTHTQAIKAPSIFDYFKRK